MFLDYLCFFVSQSRSNQEYHEFIAVLATITCLTRDGRDAATFIEKRNYYEQQLKRDAEQRNIDSPRTIVQTMSDDSDFIF